MACSTVWIPCVSAHLERCVRLLPPDTAVYVDVYGDVYVYGNDERPFVFGGMERGVDASNIPNVAGANGHWGIEWS